MKTFLLSFLLLILLCVRSEALEVQGGGACPHARCPQNEFYTTDDFISVNTNPCAMKDWIGTGLTNNQSGGALCDGLQDSSAVTGGFADINSLIGHPGVIRLSVITNGNQGGIIYSPQSSGLPTIFDPANFSFTTLLARMMSLGTAADLQFRFGIWATPVNSTVQAATPTANPNGQLNAAIFVEKLTTDTDYFLVCRQATDNSITQTRLDSGVAATVSGETVSAITSPWMRFTITRLSTTSISLSIKNTNTLVTTSVTLTDGNCNISHTNGVGMGMGFGIVADGTRTAMDADYFELDIVGLNR